MRAVGGVTLAGAAAPALLGRFAHAAPTPKSTAETAVVRFFNSLSEDQKSAIAFPFDHELRKKISANWHITKPEIDDDFYTKEQRAIIDEIIRGVTTEDGYQRIIRQTQDDAGGIGSYTVAVFGTPGSGKFEFVMTGRHMTVRADGHSEDHVAFGGPIFYGHAASGFNEKPGHPGNVFWEQGRKANLVYQMLDKKQQKLALVENRPDESAVEFHGPKGQFPGIPITELSADQKGELQKVLLSLVEPYRKEDQEEALECLRRQGGLDKCSLAFYRDGDIGNDGEWDNWRLEGPSFVWYFRGEPHVHVWVNVADDPSVKLNARG